MRQSVVVMDIDGTLSNSEHRTHLLPKNRTDDVTGEQAWREFYEAAQHDTPNVEIVALNNALATLYPIIICTGRTDRDYSMTIDWLHNADVDYSLLLMREEGDHRPDYDVKREMLETIRSIGMEPIMAVEDRRQVAEMWRAQDIRCLQVCEGDY